MQIDHSKIRRGLIATIAVLMLATTTIIFSAVVLYAAASYSNYVSREGWRIQAKYNTYSCLDTSALMFAKDFTLSGSITLSDFSCNSNISYDRSVGTISIYAISTVGGVRAYGKVSGTATGNLVNFGSDDVE